MSGDEKWKWIPGYEGLYLVSNRGQVFSIPRGRTSGGLLKQKVSQSGYQMVALSKSGKASWKLVHRLEMEAFVGVDQNRTQVNHKDGNRQNNMLDNLEWCTQQENVRHELHVLGNLAKLRKLSTEQAKEIRTSPDSCRKLAEKYGVSYSTIQCIKSGESYREAV